MFQLTISEIMNYGPWTHTLGNDREHQLQMLQARLYHKTQQLFSDKDCLVFTNRFDEFFSITNHLSLDDHIKIQEELDKDFEFDILMTVGYDKTLFDANRNVHYSRRSKVPLNIENRIFGMMCPFDEKSDVQIIHMDIEGISALSSIQSPYEISSLVIDVYNKISKFFLENKSLTFFMGGDNFMILTSKDSDVLAKQISEKIKDENNLILNYGIGVDTTSRGAALKATKALDEVRKNRDNEEYSLKQKLFQQ